MHVGQEIEGAKYLVTLPKAIKRKQLPKRPFQYL